MNLSLKNYYNRWIKSLVVIFIISTFILSLLRLGFTLYFGDFSQLKDFYPDVLRAFWLGLRFDLMPLAYIQVPPWIFLHAGIFFEGKNAIKLTRFLVLLFLQLGYFLLAFIYICDYGFYSFFQDHLNILFYGLLEDDTRAVLISIWKNYNIFFWLSLISSSLYLLYKFFILMFSPFEFDLKPRKNNLPRLICFFIGFVLLAYFARGNFGRLPLSIEDAHISSVDFINKIAINGPLSLNRTIKIRKTFGKDNYNYLKKFNFSDTSEPFEIVRHRKYDPTKSLTSQLKRKTPYREELENNPPHVIVVVMESFGTYWNFKHEENFNILGNLNNKFKEGLYFKNFLSSENGTIGSVVSVATNQVIRPGARFLSESEFMKIPLESASHLPYKRKGYETHFVYGGKLGWRDLGKYLKAQKYDELWGADEIKDSLPELQNLSAAELGNEWGIFDEYLYTFIKSKLKTAKKPQFFFVLTTTNHPPFEYPVTYKPHPIELSSTLLEKLTVREDLARKRLEGLQYANQKMSEFLEFLREGDFKENTVLALTGDHSFWIAKGVGADQEFRRFSVPFFISLPEKLKPASYNSKVCGSHEDIFPTLYNLTLSDQEYLSFGEDLLSGKSSAMNSSGIVANEYGAFHHGKYWRWENESFENLVETNESKELRSLKRYREALISLTDLYLKEEKKNKQIDVKNDQQ